jgi:hypothetical protein
MFSKRLISTCLIAGLGSLLLMLPACESTQSTPQRTTVSQADGGHPQALTGDVGDSPAVDAGPARSTGDAGSARSSRSSPRYIQHSKGANWGRIEHNR